jgi:hypothetical protein
VLELVVIPVEIVTAQRTLTASVAVAAVNDTVVVAVPEFEPVAVNVVVPHPLVVGVASDPKLKLGRTIPILSPTCNRAFDKTVRRIEVAAPVTGVNSSSLLSDMAGVLTADDSTMVDAAILGCPLSVTATVRVLRSAACGDAPVVTPVAIVTVHFVSAASEAVAAVKVKVAVEVPEFASVVENDVAPHPLVDGVDKPASVNEGSTIATASPVSRMTFIANKKDSEVGAAVSGIENVSLLLVTMGVGEPTAVDTDIAVEISLA